MKNAVHILLRGALIKKFNCKKINIVGVKMKFHGGVTIHQLYSDFTAEFNGKVVENFTR